MIDQLVELDKEIFLTLNGLHTNWLDPVMFYATNTFVWIPLYLLLLFLVLKKYRNDSWAPLAGVLITILLADQITSGIMKPLFERLRPSRDPELKNLVHIVRGYTGGLYGFASSHAANTMGVALFFWMLFKQEHKWIAILFLWAILMAYSRIYLGVHYPGDIITGMIVGILAAMLGFKLHLWLCQLSEKLARQERE
jgi:undecaprenyl-diphosphatase